MSYTRLLHKTLNCLAKTFKPKRYLEIGVREGDSLKAVLDGYRPKFVYLCDLLLQNMGLTKYGAEVYERQGVERVLFQGICPSPET